MTNVRGSSEGYVPEVVTGRGYRVNVVAPGKVAELRSGPVGEVTPGMGCVLRRSYLASSRLLGWMRSNASVMNFAIVWMSLSRGRKLS